MKKKVAQSSLVHIYFKNLGIVKYSKDSLYGWADLIGKLVLEVEVNHKSFPEKPFKIFQRNLVEAWAYAWVSVF